MKPLEISKVAEQLKGRTIKVLDDGFVRVIDFMGSDNSIVQAARVSYGKGTKKISEDRTLIRYLMRHGHTTPFEMCELKIHVRVPMDCWRQWIRHRTASVNEYSTRYSEAIDSAQRTKPDQWRRQATGNKQGSGTELDVVAGRRLTKKERDFLLVSRELYLQRLSSGVAREQARKDLPLSTYTEAYWKIDLHNLFHFLTLRMDDHAQLEIRSYANAIGYQIVRNWCPVAWEAFLDYRLKAMHISSLEQRLIALIVRGDLGGAKDLATELGWFKYSGGKITVNRERNEFESKLRILSINSPW